MSSQLETLVPIVGGDLERLHQWLTERCDLPGLLERLRAGRASAYLIAGTDAALVLSVGTTPEGSRGLWIESLGGASPMQPKANFAAISNVLTDCVKIASKSGCSEIRIEAGTRGALKQRLFARVGFILITSGNHAVMRRTL